MVARCNIRLLLQPTMQNANRNVLDSRIFTIRCPTTRFSGFLKFDDSRQTMTTDFVYIIHFFCLVTDVTNVPNGNVMAKSFVTGTDPTIVIFVVRSQYYLSTLNGFVGVENVIVIYLFYCDLFIFIVNLITLHSSRPFV